MTTATHESLFIKKLDPQSLFKKEASIARMPDDDKKWPEVVLSELHKQLPFMSGMDVSLNFTKIQPEAGYGFGYAMVRGQKNAVNFPSKSENEMVKIPIIIADRHLEPFHVFHLDGRTLPLTRGRFEEALEDPRVFAGPTKTPKTQKSLIDQLYPPYQQRQGFGRVVDGSGMSGSSMGINKTAQAPTEKQEGLSGKQKALLAGGSLLGLTGAGLGIRKLLKRAPDGIPSTIQDARKAGEDRAEALAESIGMGADARRAEADDIAAMGGPAEELPSQLNITQPVQGSVKHPAPLEGNAKPETITRLQRQRTARGNQAKNQAPTQEQILEPNLQVIDGEKQAQAPAMVEQPAMVQNPMDTLSPGQLKRLATLKQYQGIDRARAQMSDRDKQRQVLDNTAFSAAAGGVLRGGGALAAAKRTGETLSAADLGKASAKGLGTGAALSLLGQGYRSLKGKMREKDRSKEQYAQYLDTQKTAATDYNKYLMGARK